MFVLRFFDNVNYIGFVTGCFSEAQNDFPALNPLC